MSTRPSALPSPFQSLGTAPSQIAQLRQENAELRSMLVEVLGQLGEANLRILFIFETFKFGQKSPLVGADGSHTMVQQSLGDLYQQQRQSFLTRLELERDRREGSHGESVPLDADAAGPAFVTGAGHTSGTGDEEDERLPPAPAVFPDRADIRIEEEPAPLRTPGPPRLPV